MAKYIFSPYLHTFHNMYIYIYILYIYIITISTHIKIVYKQLRYSQTTYRSLYSEPEYLLKMFINTPLSITSCNVNKAAALVCALEVSVLAIFPPLTQHIIQII